MIIELKDKDQLIYSILFYQIQLQHALAELNESFDKYSALEDDYIRLMDYVTLVTHSVNYNDYSKIAKSLESSPLEILRDDILIAQYIKQSYKVKYDSVKQGFVGQLLNPGDTSHVMSLSPKDYANSEVVMDNISFDHNKYYHILSSNMSIFKDMLTNNTNGKIDLAQNIEKVNDFILKHATFSNGSKEYSWLDGGTFPISDTMNDVMIYAEILGSYMETADFVFGECNIGNSKEVYEIAHQAINGYMDKYKLSDDEYSDYISSISVVKDMSSITLLGLLKNGKANEIVNKYREVCDPTIDVVYEYSKLSRSGGVSEA